MAGEKQPAPAAPDLPDEVPFLDPESGHVTFLRKEGFDQAVAAGLKPLGKDEALSASKREYMESSPAGKLATASSGFLRGLTGGISDLALDRTGTLAGKDQEALSELNPVTSAGGHLAGFGAALFVPGAGEEAGAAEAANASRGLAGLARSFAGGAPGAFGGLGKLAEEGVLEATGSKALGTFTRGAVEGTGFQVADNLTEDVFKDKDLTAESLLAHVGPAALLGGGLGVGFEKGLGLARTHMPEAFDRATNWLDRLSSKTETGAPSTPDQIRTVVSNAERADQHMATAVETLTKQDKPEVVQELLGDSDKSAPALHQVLDQVQSKYTRPAYDASPDLEGLRAHVQGNHDNLVAFERKLYRDYKPAEVQRLLGDQQAGGVLGDVADKAVSKIDAGDHATAATKKVREVLEKAGLDQAQTKADEFLVLDKAKRELDAVKPPPGAPMTATERLYYDSIAKAREVVADSLKDTSLFGDAARLQRELNPLDAARRQSMKGFKKALLRAPENSDEAGLVAATDKVSRFAEGKDAGKYKFGDSAKNVEAYSRDAGAFVRRAAQLAPEGAERDAALKLAEQLEATPKAAETAAAGVRKARTLSKSPLEFGGTESRDAGRVLVKVRDAVAGAANDAERFNAIESTWRELTTAPKLRPGLAELRDKLGEILQSRELFGPAADHHAELEGVINDWRAARGGLKDALFTKKAPDVADPGKATTLVTRLGRGDARADLAQKALENYDAASRKLIETAEQRTYNKIGRASVNPRRLAGDLDQVNQSVASAADSMGQDLTSKAGGELHGNPLAGWVHIAGIPGVGHLSHFVKMAAGPETIAKVASKVADVTRAIAAGARGALEGGAGKTGGRLLSAEAPNISHWLDFDKLASHNTDPALLSTTLAQNTERLQQHAPIVTSGLHQTAANAAGVMGNLAPKNPLPPSGLPGDPKFEPSEVELERHREAASAVERPLSLLGRAQDGSLLSLHVEAVAQVYPRLYQKMCDEVMKAISERKEAIPYQQQLMLSTLLQRPVGFVQEQLSPMFQAEQSQTPDQPQQQPHAERTSKSGMAKMKFASAAQTGLEKAADLDAN